MKILLLVMLLVSFASSKHWLLETKNKTHKNLADNKIKHADDKNKSVDYKGININIQINTDDDLWKNWNPFFLGARGEKATPKSNQVVPYTVPPTPYTLTTSTHNHSIPQKGVGESKQSTTRISTTDPYEEIDMDMDMEAESEDENVQFIPACNTEPSGGKVESENPRPIGGLCRDYQRENIKECNGKCIPRSEVCGTKCEYDQCLAEDDSTCIEMFVDQNIYGKVLFKNCNGHCIPASQKCNGQCGETQCWQPSAGKCIDPKLDRSDKFMKKGVYGWKDCEGICIKFDEICEESCGDPALFCWEEKSQKCSSVEEKNKSGEKKRAGCSCMCIPYGDKCDGTCGYAQCEEDGKCLDVLQLNKNNTRIRMTCEEKCIPWGKECTFS